MQSEQSPEGEIPPTPPAEEISREIFEESETVSNKGQNAFPKEQKFLIIEKVASQLEQNREQRVVYALKTFWLTCIWIFIVLAIVIGSGFKWHNSKVLELSDKVIVTLITTTTINVFGFLFS